MKSEMSHFVLTVCLSVTVILLNLGSITCVELNQNELIVDAGSLGKIKGIQMTTLGATSASRRPYIAFNGLKYAESPAGENRFRPSTLRRRNMTADGQPYYNAALPGLACIQLSVIGDITLPQSEDCLSLNVHTPRLPGNNSPLLPVIFFIHGGAFTSGTGTLYSGARLLNRDVVLVSINYRLGVFGFYALDNEDVPGSAGLYDMLTALQWTNEFIQYFGGDPRKITIAGQSSGSVSVTHLVASQLSRGLFRSAIAASGSALSSWGTATPEQAMRASISLAELCNCYDSSKGYPSDEDKVEIARCMRNDVSAKAFVDALLAYQIQERKEGRLGFDAVSAVVQGFEVAPGSSFKKFLPIHPEEAYKAKTQANVPLLIGTTRHDGSYVLGVLYQRFLRANGYLNDTEFLSKQAVPMILKGVDIESELGVQSAIAKLYLGESRKTGDFSQMYPGFIDVRSRLFITTYSILSDIDNHIDQVIRKLQLLTVLFFKAPTYQTALYHTELNNNQTYWYSFNHYGRYTMFGLLFFGDVPPIEPGVGHGDDLIYLFQTSLPLSDADMAISNKMVDHYANFATYGHPTGPTENATAWPHLTSTEQKYCSIGPESVVLEHPEDEWSGVGWEVLPPTLPTRGPTTPTTEATTSPGDGGSDSDAATSLSFSLPLYLITLLVVVFSSSKLR